MYEGGQHLLAQRIAQEAHSLVRAVCWLRQRVYAWLRDSDYRGANPPRMRNVNREYMRGVVQAVSEPLI